MDFQEKVVLITGASQGIGAAAAKAFATQGAKLALLARSEEKLKALKEEIGKQTEVEVYPADVSEKKSVEQAIEKVLADFGKVSVLINNAGITRDNLFLRMKEEEWDEVFQVNVKGAFYCTKAVVRSMMKAREGVILNISSVVGLFGNLGQANYGASKAALIGFTKSLAKELGRWNIRVNAIAPGFIQTDMVKSLEDKMEEVTKHIPLKRLGTPEEVAEVCVFLASPRASYITGAVIQVDGGLFA